MSESGGPKSLNSDANLSSEVSFAANGRPDGAGAARARWAVLLIALPSAVQAFAFLRMLLYFITVHNEGAYPESIGVYGFVTAFRTHRFYQPPFAFPWIAQIFGPLFVMLGSLFARMFHGDPTPLTAFVRALSFVSFLGSVALVAWLGLKLEKSKMWAAAAAILGLGCFWLVPIAAAVRPDLPAIFLILAALAIYEAAGGRPWLFFLAGAVGAASFLTKQNTAPILLALLIDRLWARRFKEACIFIAGGLAVAIPVFGVLWLRQEPFLANFTVISFAVYDWPSVPSTLINFLRVNQLALLSISIALIGASATWKEQKYRASLLVTVLAWVSNVAALANVGGGVNYLVLPWLLTMLFIPAGLKQLERWAERRLWIPVGVFLLAALVVIHQRSLLHIKLPRNLSTDGVGNLTILGDNPYLELRSRQPQLMDSFTYNEMLRRGVWSDAGVRARVDAEDYDLLWLGGANGNAGSAFLVASFRDNSFWGADLLGAMRLHYRPLCETEDHLAMVPRDRPSSIQNGTIEEIVHQPCSAASVLPQVTPGSN